MLFLILSIMATTPAVGTIAYYTQQGKNLQEAQAARKAFLQSGWSTGNINTQSSTQSNEPVYSANVTPVVTAIGDSTWVEWFTPRSSSSRSSTPKNDWMYSEWVKPTPEPVKSEVKTSVGTKSQVDELKGSLTKETPTTSSINWETEEEARKRLGLVDFSTKPWTYQYFIKQGLTPDKAREAAMAALQKWKEKKGSTTPTTVNKDYTGDVTPENVYETSADIYAANEAKRKAAEWTVKSSSEKAAEDIKSKEMETYNTMESAVTKERDDFVSKLNEMQTGYEGTRLNQVRGQIIQWLQSRGVNVQNLTPEQLIQLSGDVGSKAFTDIYAAKVETENKVKAARDLALNKLNELLAKKAITETTYTENINNINNAYTKNMASIATDTANFMLWVREKKAADMKSVTSTALNLLATIGIPNDQMYLFADVIKWATTPEEAMQKIALAKLTPEQQKAYDEGAKQRSATAVAEQALKEKQLNQEYTIAMQKIAADRANNDSSLAAKERSNALDMAGYYIKLAESPTTNINDKAIYQEKARQLLWTLWGGASTTSP